MMGDGQHVINGQISMGFFQLTLYHGYCHPQERERNKCNKRIVK